jgi:hypothetical protein
MTHVVLPHLLRRLELVLAVVDVHAKHAFRRALSEFRRPLSENEEGNVSRGEIQLGLKEADLF